MVRDGTVTEQGHRLNLCSRQATALHFKSFLSFHVLFIVELIVPLAVQASDDPLVYKILGEQRRVL